MASQGHPSESPSPSLEAVAFPPSLPTSKCAQQGIEEEDGALWEIKNLELLFHQVTEERAQAEKEQPGLGFRPPPPTCKGRQACSLSVRQATPWILDCAWHRPWYLGSVK